MYYRYPVLNNSFGPFINHNHFPFYLNMCIGLGGGLLLSLRHPDREGDPTSGAALDRRGLPSLSAWFSDALDILNKPAPLWVALALAFMATRGPFSLSAG